MSDRQWQRRGVHAKRGRKARQRALEELAQVRRAHDLIDEFPELDEEANARLLLRMAEDYAVNVLGRPDLAKDPQLWRLLWIAHRDHHYAAE